MKRRDFVLAMGGAVAWPLAGRAQAMRKIGYLAAGSQSAFATRVVAFKEGLGSLGFVDGRDVTIEYRFVDGMYDRLQAAAADLVAQRVDVIVALGPPSLRAAKAATSTIPIVFVIGSDPVRDGFVASMSRPGGNITGISFLAVDLTPKRLELVSELVPKAKRIALFANPTNAAEERVVAEVQEAAQGRGFQFQPLRASSDREIDAAFATLAQQRDSVLIVSPDSFFTTKAEQLVALANRHAVPAIYAFREFVAAGGLVSYAPAVPPLHRQSGVYAARILKGEKPGDLPVMQPTTFALVINLKTAKTLGLDVAATVLARADEVIE
jgi:putative tryptophan/tyrosine transport system substrate-binding protein